VTRQRILILPTAALAAALAISACTPSASTAPPSAPSTSPAAVQPSGPAGGDFAKIQQCLEAAGIALPTGSFAAPPPGARPSGPLPSGAFPGGSFNPPNGLGTGLNDPKVQAALEACGLTPPGGPAPTN
jgi:hypothetical protein